MMYPNAWATPQWLIPSCALMLVALVVAIFAYRNVRGSLGLRSFLIGLKTLALMLLALILLEPLTRYETPQPGANLLMLMVDDSQSLQIRDLRATEPRSAEIDQRLNQDVDWLNRLASVFDLRRYQFDQVLRPVANYSEYAADQRGSNLTGNLKMIASRFSDRPTAGIVVITDGNDLAATRQPLAELMASFDWERMPPIYPVVVGAQQPAADLGIERVVTSETNFESAPVTMDVELIGHNITGRKVIVDLLDETGEQLERREVGPVESDTRFKVRFQAKPQNQGVNAYQVHAMIDGDQGKGDESKSLEATIVNNRESLVVNRGRGPFRVLYVCGRPNWEMKFLNRAMKDDAEVNLVSLIRIAKREAKFVFKGREGQQSNSLFRGFETQDEDTTEQHDEPVFLRIGTRDEIELKGGFPKSPEELFQYDGIILDDVEASFFNTDQHALIQEFVAVRGGGLMMMGGQESFASGGYDQTGVGEMMPVYLDRIAPSRREVKYQMDLTREGWLQPWVRVRRTEAEEKTRLLEMPLFRTINRTNSIKPGASVLATVSGGGRQDIPALVVQPFGAGRVGAMLVGDFWRWHMQTELSNDDQYKAWRQTLRWLVADVPRRVELKVEPEPGSLNANQIQVLVRNERFEPEDNATVKLSVWTPDGQEIELTTSTTEESGVYVSRFSSNLPGVYRATAKVLASDGSDVEQREIGWVCDPDQSEFQSLVPNRELLEALAERSGGKLFELDNVDRLPSILENQPVPVVSERTIPWWHQWSVLMVAIGLLVTEWGIRRWKGLP